MPIKKLPPKAKSKSGLNPKLVQLKKHLAEFETLKEENNAANNAVNRKKTAIKGVIHEYLKDNGGTVNDGIIIDGIEIAHRPNISDEIDPQTFHQWFVDKKISRNQYFRSISVSVTEARNAIGNDQIAEISHTTLSKTADLRISKEATSDAVEGAIVPFVGAKVKTSKEAKQVKVDTVGKPLPIATRKKVKRRIKL